MEGMLVEITFHVEIVNENQLKLQDLYSLDVHNLIIDIIKLY